MKVEFSGQTLEKYSNIKFHENRSSGSRVILYGLTDVTTLVVAFRLKTRHIDNQIVAS
jgi:hypothetical protein